MNRNNPYQILGAAMYAPNRENWLQAGNCYEDPSLLEVPDGMKGKQKEAQIERIKRHVCGLCPVRVLCLESALAQSEQVGIRGGRTDGERNAILADRAELERLDAEESVLAD